MKDLIRDCAVMKIDDPKDSPIQKAREMLGRSLLAQLEELAQILNNVKDASENESDLVDTHVSLASNQVSAIIGGTTGPPAHHSV